MKKTIALIILCLLFLIFAIVGVKALQIFKLIETGKSFVPPPISISSVEVKPFEWETTLNSIGSLEAAKGLVITADLSGRISKINFEAGAEVSAGDLLIEQESTTERAQLRSAQSTASLAKKNFARISQLFERGVASKSDFDSAENDYRSTLAEVDNIRASIAKKSIFAPFDGRLGIRLVDLGQSIDAGEPVVSLQASDQMFVNFFLPQQDLPQLEKNLNVSVTTDAVPDQVFTGKVNAINPEINISTRSVEIQAILANPDNVLSPGMFAEIDVVMPKTRSVLLIPITAVQYATFGDSVFVIEDTEKSEGELNLTSDTLTVRQQFVRLGKTRGDYVIVEKGLEQGQSIVSAGGFKLRNGAAVVVNNTVVPDFSLNPILENQ